MDVAVARPLGRSPRGQGRVARHEADRRAPAGGGRLRRGRAEKPVPLQRRIDAILDRPALAAGVLGGRGPQRAHRPRPLRAERGEELQARVDAEGGHHRRRARRVRPRRALPHHGGDRRPPRRPRADRRATSTSSGGGDPNLSGRFHEGRAIAPFEQLADAAGGGGRPAHRGPRPRARGAVRRRPPRRGLGVGRPRLVLRGRGLRAGPERQLRRPHRRARRARGRRGRDRRLSAVELLPGRLHRDHVRRAARPGELRLERDLGGNVIRISGTHAIGQRPWQGSVALEDPARFAATVFREVLVAKGHRRSPGEADTLVGAASRPRGASWPPCESAPRVRADRDHQQEEPEPAHRDAAAPAGRAARRRGHAGERGGGGRGVPAPHGRAPGGVAAAGRLRPVALRPPLAARDGHAAGGHGPPSRTPRSSGPACPSPGWTARWTRG